jgi:hypothetical protein
MAIDTMACFACNKEIPATAAVCEHCGKGFSGKYLIAEDEQRRMALRRGLTPQSVAGEDQPRIEASPVRFVGALLACALIIFGYWILRLTLGVKHSGVIEMFLLVWGVGATWRGITGKRKGSAPPTQETAS